MFNTKVIVFRVQTQLNICIDSNTTLNNYFLYKTIEIFQNGSQLEYKIKDKSKA